MSNSPTATQPTAQQLLRPLEAAERLAISPRTLWELTKRGAIESVRLGRSVRYSPTALAAFTEKGGAR
jgi:excisionase family DNA binding protein